MPFGTAADPVTLAPGTTEYTARVVNSINVVTITATTTNNPAATRTISPGDADTTDDANGHQVALRAGQKTRITVRVLAEDRSTRQTYTVTVYRERSTRSDNATLSALSLDGVSLSPRFSSGTITYDARVRYDVKTVTVEYTAADIGALVPEVTVLPVEAVPDAMDDDATDNVYLLGNPGTNTGITVAVTAENGTEDETDDYTITVYRESGPVLSDDATLVETTGLSLTDVPFGTTEDSVPFAAGTTEYTARVGNAVESVTVEATVAGAPGATFDIMPADQIADDDDVTGSTGHQVYLTPGTNTAITVTVTAENRSTNTYTVMVYRERRIASTDATLSALSLDGVSLSPRFSSGTITYDARVGYDVKTVTVEYTAADIGALVPEVTVLPVEAVPDAMDDDATDNVYLLGNPGTNTGITVAVTAENGTEDETDDYTITVYRESGPVLSDEATLVGTTGLSLTDDDTMNVPFGTTEDSVPFAAGTTEYTARVDNDVEFVTVAATAAGAPGATYDIMPADRNILDTGHQVYLTAGVHTAITVTVTAENRSTNTYTVMVYRERTTVSTDATLSALSLDGVSLSPLFSSGTTAYNARVRYDVSEVTVEYTAADIGTSAAVTVLPDSPVPGAVDTDTTDNVYLLGNPGTKTVITVAVTAENGTPDATDDYMITVYRENIVLSDIATLMVPDDPGLLGSGVTLTPAFLPGTNEYTARTSAVIDVITDFATVDATPTDNTGGAMVDIMPADRDSLEDGHQVYLAPGAHTAITVTVTAENGSTNTYTFMVYRLRVPPFMDATLSELRLSGAVLSPVFDPKRTEYTATAAYNTDITTVTATANDIGAMVPVVGSDALVEERGNQVTLSSRNATIITVTVEAEGGDPTDDADNGVYEITVYRDPAPSSDATLQTLTLSGITLSPAFDPATTEYTAEVETLDMTMVVAMATHSGATVEGAVQRSLTVGENVIMVTVAAEDGETSQTYTVTVTVLMGSTLLERYDTNDNDKIDRNEAVQAIRDYIAGEITRADAVAIIRLYIAG